eukprot:TRINITY_DN1020_c0_g1_i2.p1 TRINITY_DN1020_c0_g1~~TRINITY_DN1020_c0_g1_i2.p1  ORF type:complete len:327 (+),score=31.46 TRINITY_DN1020_c0_g1_i2:122-1102(+)
MNKGRRMGGACTRGSFDSVERISSMAPALSSSSGHAFGATDKAIIDAEAKRAALVSSNDEAELSSFEGPPARVVHRQRSMSAPGRILPMLTVQPPEDPSPVTTEEFTAPPPSRESHTISMPSFHQGVHLGDLWVIAAARSRSKSTSDQRSPMAGASTDILPGAVSPSKPAGPAISAELTAAWNTNLRMVARPVSGLHGARLRALSPIAEPIRSPTAGSGPDGSFMTLSPNKPGQPSALPAIAPTLPPVPRVVQARSKVAILEETIHNAPAHVRATMSHAARIIQRNYRNFRLMRVLAQAVLERRMAVVTGKPIRPKNWKLTNEDSE